MLPYTSLLEMGKLPSLRILYIKHSKTIIYIYVCRPATMASGKSKKKTAEFRQHYCDMRIQRMLNTIQAFTVAGVALSKKKK